MIPSTLTVWAAGVAASGLGRLLSTSTDRAGRVPVGNDCSLLQHPEVFVIGDLALFKDEHGKPLPGVAQVAIQQGRAVAANIGREIEGQMRQPFHYKDLGNLATIGRAAAVADIRHSSRRLDRLDGVAVHSHPVADRLSQSPIGDGELDLGILCLAARAAADYG